MHYISSKLSNGKTCKREIKEIVVELEKEMEKHDRKLEEDRKKFKEEKKRWREKHDRKLDKEMERLFQMLQESVQNKQEDLERMPKEKVFEKCTRDVLEVYVICCWYYCLCILILDCIYVIFMM